ncbi:hypothetical protein GCK72_003896 [Caenorhabditis remanei]|uniref:Sdz-33 F-box domain-containing protein n=1 Tax=Caenorhabditis remanei TaxID=31234 RepID=A0A6A5H7Y6_CAERE|nr:hypothetical protein GCK72_003896 [Caenorhabditis remanei]KAF1763950.1 hypothetical protein GCK72_003896 [Caenorhabditis remanei]
MLGDCSNYQVDEDMGTTTSMPNFQKMELITRSINLASARYGCCFKDTDSSILIGVGNQRTSIICGSAVPEVIVENCLIREELSKWLKPTDTNELETMLSILEKVIPILPCRYNAVYLELAEMRTISIQDVFSHSIIRNSEGIVIKGDEEIPSDDLDYILETASRLKHLRLLNTSPPYGYNHGRIFELKNFEFPTSEWISIEHLLKIKNSVKMNIGKNRLNYADLNRFLKYWIQSEIDMFNKYIHIEMEEDIPEDVLFNGILRLNSDYFEAISYFIKADSYQQQRNKPVLSIWYEEQTLKLTAWSPDKRWRNVDGETGSFQGEYDALRAVERRMELEQTLKENYDDEKILNEIRELNEQLEQLQEELNFTIAECI